MTQGEILEFLKKNPEEWFRTHIIMNAISIGNGSGISKSLASLRKTDFIEFKFVDGQEGVFGHYEYKHKG